MLYNAIIIEKVKRIQCYTTLSRECNAIMIEKIRRQIPYEEFDYQAIMHSLKDYVCPRDKISDLLKKGSIIRVKKGLYVFGNDYRRRPVSRELLANLIYGPSYISSDYALHYYGLIPERSEAVTSVTSGRSRKFATPLGLFIYTMIPPAALRTGMDSVEFEENRSFLIAIPEKALADKVRSDRGVHIRTQRDMKSYLFHDLRIDTEAFLALNPQQLDLFAANYRSRRIQILATILQKLQRQEGKIDNA